MKRSLSILLAFLLVFSFAGCKKKPEQAAGEGALGGKLVRNLPATTLFFFATNTSTESYQSLKKSSLFSAGTRLSGSIEDIIYAAGAREDEEGTGPKEAIDALKNAGVIPGGPNEGDLFEEVVVFGDVEDGKIVLALVASAAKGKDLQPAFRSVIDAFQKIGLEVKDEAFRGINGHRLKVKEPAANSLFEYAYAATSESQMVLSSSKNLLQSFFDGSAVNGLPELKSRPLFQEAMRGIPSMAQSYSFGFFDIQKFKEAAASTPALQESLAEMAVLPVDAAVFSSSFEDSLLTDVGVVARAKTEEDKKWIEPLAVRSSHSLTANAPGSLFFYLGLDGQVFKKLNDANKNAGQGMQEAILSDETLAGLKELMIGMRMNETGSPFPDIIVAADTADAGAATKSLEGTLGGLAAMTGMPVGQWTEKKLGKTTLRFINSPMGIGAYLAALDHAALLGTTEGVVNEMIKTSNGEIPSFSARLNRETSDYIKREQPGVFLYVNFARLASVLETFQGTLAAFSGGEGQFDQSQIDALKKMGAFSLGGSYQEPLLKVHSELSLPEADK